MSTAFEAIYYRRFELINARSSKFWDITLKAASGNNTVQMITSWGRIGATAQTLTRLFANVVVATEVALVKCQEKLDKGYKEIGGYTGKASFNNKQEILDALRKLDKVTKKPITVKQKNDKIAEPPPQLPTIVLNKPKRKVRI